MSAKPPHIAVMLGSLRSGSLNRKLCALATQALGREGATVDVVDLRVSVLPIFDQDVETADFPAAAKELGQRLQGADGILFVSPEYNAGIPGGLKNAIDWATRPPPHNPFRHKPAAIMGASPGQFGTARMQLALRQTLTSVGAFVLPQSVHIALADSAFTPEGALVSPGRQKDVNQLAQQLVQLSRTRVLPGGPGPA